jgi:energy-coupling factor transport system ATP-binding protein
VGQAAAEPVGLAVTLAVYGGIMNPVSVLLTQEQPTVELFLTAYAMGLPFDLIHAVSTALFLWLIAGPMTEKMQRMKLKYGLIYI